MAGFRLIDIIWILTRTNEVRVEKSATQRTAAGVGFPKSVWSWYTSLISHGIAHIKHNIRKHAKLPASQDLSHDSAGLSLGLNQLLPV